MSKRFSIGEVSLFNLPLEEMSSKNCNFTKLKGNHLCVIVGIDEKNRMLYVVGASSKRIPSDIEITEVGVKKPKRTFARIQHGIRKIPMSASRSGCFYILDVHKFNSVLKAASNSEENILLNGPSKAKTLKLKVKVQKSPVIINKKNKILYTK